jgi:hypothetical protein
VHKPFASLLLAVGALLLLFTVVAADFSLEQWQYVKSLSLPAGVNADEPMSLILDEEIFVHSADGLADLRLISEAGVETPYLVESLSGSTARIASALQVIDHGYVLDTHSQITLDFGPGAIRHNVVELGSPSLTELWREVVIEASQDNISWSSIGADEIYRVVKGSTVVESYTLGYPTSSSRYVRLKFIDDGTGDLQMGSAVGFHEERVPPQLITSRPTSMSQVNDTTERTSTIDFDLGRSGVPFHNISLATADQNFNRRVMIQASLDREKWVSLPSRDEIFSYRAGLNPLDRLDIQISETTVRYVRLVVFNQDNPPIEITSGEFEGYQKQMVFLANSSQDYSLFYGNDESSAPIYDTGIVIGNRVDSAELLSVAAGPHSDNGGYAPLKEPLTERLPWLMPLLIAFISALVGLLLFSVFRKARSLAPPP